jgi:hypothetical protein
MFLVSWLAPYVLFQFFFMPMNYFYKLFIFVPLLGIFGWYGTIEVVPEKKWFKWSVFAFFIIFTAFFIPLLAILVTIFIVVFEVFQHRKNELYRWGLFILVVFLALYNNISGIQPESTLEHNPEVQHALELQDHFHDGDLLIFEGGYEYPEGWIIPALTRAEVVTLGELYSMTGDQREDLLNSVERSGGRIFVHPNITDMTDQFIRNADSLGINVDDLADLLKQYQWQEGFTLNDRLFVQMVPE